MSDKNDNKDRKESAQEVAIDLDRLKAVHHQKRGSRELSFSLEFTDSEKSTIILEDAERILSKKWSDITDDSWESADHRQWKKLKGDEGCASIDEQYCNELAYCGMRFKHLDTELRFLHEHSILHRRTVYAGYLFQLIAGLINIGVDTLLSTREGVCHRVSEDLHDECLQISSGGNPDYNSISMKVLSSISFIVASLVGSIVHWQIHRSNRIRNKAWALLAVWIVYAVQIIEGFSIQILLDTGLFWALNAFEFYIRVFLTAVWFTGLLFWQSLLLFTVACISYYGLSVNRAVNELKLTSDETIPLSEINSHVLGYQTYKNFAFSAVLFCAIALVSSYMNEQTSRMRYLERLYITKQQNIVIRQKTRSENMQRSFLENMLPASIVDQLQVESFSMKNFSFKKLSRRHQGVSILFADIAGFTSFATQVNSATVMTFLNELFLHFDSLCDRYNVYKVETVGDCYVAAVGVVTGQIMTTEMDEDECENSSLLFTSKSNTRDMVGFAKQMIGVSHKVMKPKLNSPALMRVGIHSGPCMSGIVGTKNMRYCLFGDTMNTAARMEQTGVVGAIQVSEDVADLVPDEPWELRGSIKVKGKGSMDTYLLHMEN